MPHQCTDCGRRFDDGSKEMLSGCPDCGGNKFQFLPSSASDPDSPQQTTPETTSTTQSESSVARTVGNAATAVRDLVGRSSGPESPATSDSVSSAAMESTSPSSSDTGRPEPRRDRPDEQTNRTITSRPDTEDAAQASARSELVSQDELPSTSETERGWEQTTPGPRNRTDTTDTAVTDTETTGTDDDITAATERPDLSELRAELNQQFESIKVVKPGEYELNLMELFDRQEYIIALQEDGKYTVQVPEHWQD